MADQTPRSKNRAPVVWFMTVGDDAGELVVRFRPHFEKPTAWGVVLADVVRHVASAYAQQDGSYDPGPAAEQILLIMKKELANRETKHSCYTLGGPDTRVRYSGEGGGR